MRHYLQVESQPKAQSRETEAINIEANYSKCFDDDGRLKRTGKHAKFMAVEIIELVILNKAKVQVPHQCSYAGTLWTATSHIITAVIGSGVLSLAWAVGQLGWVAGPVVMTLFAVVNLYTSNLLAQCYRAGDLVTGQRNYTYMDAVKANLGALQVFH